MNGQTTAWIPGEPNNFQSAEEDCACVRYISDNKLLLNDAPCNFKESYICEVEIPTA